jgi:murein L,D-transpeptidase YcbB/YkuD
MHIFTGAVQVTRRRSLSEDFALRVLITVFSACLLSPVPLISAGAETSGANGGPVIDAGILQNRLDSLSASRGGSVAGIALDPRDPLFDFYRARAFRPAWTEAARFQDLLGAIGHAQDEGLNPEDYLAATLARLRDAHGVSVDLEILASESLLRYASDRRFGKVDANALLHEPLVALPVDGNADAIRWLTRASEAPSLADFLAGELRDAPWTERLKIALARYRAIGAAGGWRSIDRGPTLQQGDTGPRVRALRERLASTGDLPGAPPGADPEFFDGGLQNALRSAQARHGIEADGRAGLRTIEALNVSVFSRIGELRVAVERARWIGTALPARAVIVNIPAYRASLIAGEVTAWESRAIVGQPRRPTPELRAEIRSVVINPDWTVPPTIVREDVLPQLKRDISYLARENLRVVGPAREVVDPAAIDWSRFSRGIPYALVQEPGPRNALGRLKFVFPNPHSVYMHDTPAKLLFDKTERAFSSGCIRVEDPLGLARILLGDSGWDGPALEGAIAARRTRTINIGQPIPILLVYWTTVADPDSILHFYRDVYSINPRILAALDAPPAPFVTRSAARPGCYGPQRCE